MAQLIGAAELSDDGAARELGLDEAEGSVRRWSRRAWRSRWPRVPVKLLGAMTSAAVTAVVIVIAVVVGTVVLRAPHGRPTGAPSTSVSGPPVGSLVFRPLPLGPHWHGHLDYALSNAVVYLTGIATPDQPGSQSGGYGPIATLPSSARPVGSLDLVVATSAGDGAVQIAATGQIEVIGQHAFVRWVSLGGVSFPVGSR